MSALTEFNPDIILADYYLPTFSGLSALTIVKNTCPHIPLIIVTGSLSEDIAVSCIKAGATDYIIKEHIMRLPSAIKSALETRKIKDDSLKALDIFKQQNQFLNDILESLAHPFLVIDADTYQIKKSNTAAREKMSFKGGIFCYEATCCRNSGNTHCGGCPIEQVKEKRKPVSVEHVFQFKNVDSCIFEVHSYPIFDDGKNVKEVIAYFIDISSRKKAEEQIRKSLEEKEILLKEIYHRVKNNLQVISSLINLQGQSVKADTQVQGMFLKSRDRIQAMALMHEKLYQSHDLNQIDFVQYIHELMAHLFCSYGISPDDISLKITANDLLLDMNTAVPSGLIINELVSNSLKHAFPEGQKGQITIALFSHENRTFNLIISDDGIGIPKNLDINKVESLGLQLVNTLVSQLGGEMTMKQNHGTTFQIIFSPAKDSLASDGDGIGLADSNYSTQPE